MRELLGGLLLGGRLLQEINVCGVFGLGVDVSFLVWVGSELGEMGLEGGRGGGQGRGEVEEGELEEHDD